MAGPRQPEVCRQATLPNPAAAFRRLGALPVQGCGVGQRSFARLVGSYPSDAECHDAGSHAWLLGQGNHEEHGPDLRPGVPEGNISVDGRLSNFAGRDIGAMAPARLNES